MLGMRWQQGELPPALLAAVEEAIRARGVSSLSLRDVARRAGVSHGAPAHHFRNKSGLLTVFATQGYEQLVDMIGLEIERSTSADGAATLAAVGRGYVRFAIENPERFETMFRLDALDVGDAAFNAASERAYSMLVVTVEACRHEGRLEGLDAQLVSLAAWSLVHGLATLLISGRIADRIDEKDPYQLAVQVSQLFVERVLTRPGE
jgi:AcrR family transcriptional regulator